MINGANEELQKNNLNRPQPSESKSNDSSGANIISSFKEKYISVLKYLGYYIVILIGIFIAFNLTDFFNYKTAFSNNQVALNKGFNLVNKYNKNEKSNLETILDTKYGDTKYKIDDFFTNKTSGISGFFCVDTEGVVKKIDTQDINNSLLTGKKIDYNLLNKAIAIILANSYAYCGRDANIYKVYYNKVYNGNILTDVLTLSTSGGDEDNIYKIYKYLISNDSSKTETICQLQNTINVYYPDLAKQLKLENTGECEGAKNDTNINLIDRELYSAENILLSNKTTISIFKEEISDIKTWYDGNDNLSFFSTMSFISNSFYDLAVFNFKGTIKYIFDSILYNIPFINFVYLNISSFVLTGILSILLFLVLDMLPMTLLSLGSFFKIENILYYIATFFYTFVFYFIEIMIVIFLLSKIIGFFINIS